MAKTCAYLCRQCLFIDGFGEFGEYCKTRFFACALFREPGEFVKITGRENLNTVAFQCRGKQTRQNYGVQNNYIHSNAKIKGGQN